MSSKVAGIGSFDCWPPPCLQWLGSQDSTRTSQPIWNLEKPSKSYILIICPKNTIRVIKRIILSWFWGDPGSLGATRVARLFKFSDPFPGFS